MEVPNRRMLTCINTCLSELAGRSLPLTLSFRLISRLWPKSLEDEHFGLTASIFICLSPGTSEIYIKIFYNRII